MSQQELHRLIYLSSATRPMSDEDLEAILSKARGKNEGLDVSGLLLYSDGDFFQLLEGPLKVIQDLYAVIQVDDRHTGCIEIVCEPIEKREFEDWSMGFRRISREEVSGQVSGFNDLMERNKLDQDFVKKTSDEVLTFLKTFRGETLE